MKTLPGGSPLKPTLDRLYADYNHADSATDPIQIVRRYTRPDDREVVAFCAASLAFGRVASVLQSIERLMTVFAHRGDRPADFVRRFDPRRDAPAFKGLVHRWIRERDLVALVWVLKQMLDRSATIEGFFLEGYDPAAGDVATALDSFSERAMALDLTAAYGRPSTRSGQARGVAYFFPRPSKGSACKRLNLFLRWMVRREPPDFGLWTSVAPSRLLMPIDTHIENISRSIGLTQRRSRNWRMAEEITQRLALVDAADPVKFDFALCHKRMSGDCLDRRDAKVCAPCGFKTVCRHWRGRAARA